MFLLLRKNRGNAINAIEKKDLMLTLSLWGPMGKPIITGCLTFPLILFFIQVFNVKHFAMHRVRMLMR